MSDTDNLELKKRARRRLVGAAALALLAIIILPMIMDDEPVLDMHDIQVSIPEPSSDARPIASRESLNLLVPPIEREGEAEALALAPLPEAPRSETPPAETPPAVSGKPAPEKPSASSATSTPQKPATSPPPSRSQEAAAEAAEAARAKAILEGRAAAAASAKAAETASFVVQVGAFSDVAKASTRRDELASRGFKAFIETREGVSRVRMGPFSARSDAEAAVRRLEAASIDGVILTR